MIELYQFPISHYCEKIRWALDYKGLAYKTRNLLPGLHILKTKKIANSYMVPILVHDGKVIKESSNIISYLDEQFPDKCLTPEDKNLRHEALKWEAYIDSEIGVHLRLCCYHILLDHPEILVPFFTHNGPWYGKFLITRMFPKLRVRMLNLLKINDQSAQASREKLSKAVDKLFEHFQEKPFLVGNSFTRADLTAASLLAPLYMPDKYGLSLPDPLPVKLQALVDEFREKTQWVPEMYRQFR
ncbi:MAG: glutathione S-transferase [Gammaproteobacteria bacterium]|nr:glutathione S-transferase [Gammaproteobacteria bacterium]